MGPPVRIIARLDLKGPNVVKGIHLEGLRIVGSPAELAGRYYRQGADELLLIDIVASLYQRETFLDIVRAAAGEVFVPITVGGGIRSLEDIALTLRNGADKVAINTAAIARPALLTEASEAFGSQCIVLSVEAKRQFGGGRQWEAWTDNGRERTGRSVLDWVAEGERLGVGEILVTSIDKEGTTRGLDLELMAEVRRRVRIPVIASGGVGRSEHVAEAFSQKAADAVACAYVLHAGLVNVAQIKDEVRARGIPVRPV
jgi:cyclase